MACHVHIYYYVGDSKIRKDFVDISVFQTYNKYSNRAKQIKMTGKIPDADEISAHFNFSNKMKRNKTEPNQKTNSIAIYFLLFRTIF